MYSKVRINLQDYSLRELGEWLDGILTDLLRLYREYINKYA